MARVGVDLDGVGYVFGESWIRAAKEFFGDSYREVDPNSGDWYYYRTEYTDQQFMDAFAFGVNRGIIFTGPVNEGFPEMVKSIQMHGHSIHIVTDRSVGWPGCAQYSTVEWLSQHGVPYDSITFSRDKTVVKTDFFIDDKLENYDALREAGTACYLLNRPWNQADDRNETENGAPRARINSLDEFARLVIDNVRDFTALHEDLPLG